MARSKQPAVKREPSSEYFNKNTASWENTNGNHKGANGHVVEKVSDVVVEKVLDVGLDKPDAGVVQLVIAVAGIYASL